MNLFRQQVKEELQQVAEYDKQKAEDLEKLIFGRDSDLDWALTAKISKEEIKMYPGSSLGPEPEDDPDTWAKWYYEHQPPSAFKDGVVNGADLGVKYKFIKPKGDMQTVGLGAQNHIYKNPILHFFESDKLYE